MLEALSYSLGESLNIIVPSHDVSSTESLHLLARFFPERHRIEKAAAAYLGSYTKAFGGIRQLPPGSNGKLVLGLLLSAYS